MLRTIFILVFLRENQGSTILGHLNLEESSIDRLTQSLFEHAKLHQFKTEAQFPPCPKNTTKACTKTQSCVMIERRLCDGPTCTMVPMGTCVVHLTPETSELPQPAPLSASKSATKKPSRHKNEDYFSLNSGSPSLESKDIVRRALTNHTVAVHVDVLTPVYQLTRSREANLERYSPIFHLLGDQYSRDRHVITGDGFHINLHRGSACRRLPRAQNLAVIFSDPIAIQLNQVVGRALTHGKQSITGAVSSRYFSGDTQVFLYKTSPKKYVLIL